MDHVKGLQNVVENSKNLGAALPNEMKAFSNLFGEVFIEGANMKKREYIALGIAVAVRCEGCIEAHTRNLINLDVSREEIAEIISVAVLMGGGPSTVYGGKALEAFDQLSK